MQWFKKLKNFISVLFEGDIVNDFVDDGQPFHIIPLERSFLQTSVKGDFRLHLLANGFCANWRSCLVGRNNDGLFLWKLDGWARCVDVSPDKTKFAAAKDRSICIFNASTGKALSEVQEIGIYLDFLIWLDNHRLIGTDGEQLYIFNSEGQLVETLSDAIEKEGFIGGLCPDAQHAHLVNILDVNAHELKRIDLNQRQVVAQIDADYAEQLLFNRESNWIWTTVVNGTSLEEIKIYDSRNLREKYGVWFKGKEGTRFANQPPNDISYHSWISLPSLSPLRQHFLVNDNSGLLWLIDARTGDKRRIFRRNLLNYVYATTWLDNEHFVAMLEDGYVVKMSIRGKELMFKEQDLAK